MIVNNSGTLADCQWSTRDSQKKNDIYSRRTLIRLAIIISISIVSFLTLHFPLTHTPHHHRQLLPTPVSLTSFNAPGITLLMGFPFSGQTFLQRSIHDTTGTSTAINYGQAMMKSSSGVIIHGLTDSIPLYSSYPNGPFAFSDTHPFPAGGQVLTRTYCGGHCVACWPKEYVTYRKKFFNECMHGTKFIKGQELKVTDYDPVLVKKYVHLIRDPLSHVAARFENQVHRWKVSNKQDYISRYRSGKIGFQRWCQDWDDNYFEGRRFEMEKTYYYLNTDEIVELAKKVPCHTDFFRVVQWHNLAFEVGFEELADKPGKLTLAAYFSSRGNSNGFLPRYRYPAELCSSAAVYLPDGSMYPGPAMFGPVKASYRPGKTEEVLGIRGSARVGATPFHAVYVLDVFYRSEQREFDVDRLYEYFEMIYYWHEFLHETVMRGCPMGGNSSPSSNSNSNSDGDDDNTNDTPCYNIIHPWESEIELYSPLWAEVLRPTIDKIRQSSWTPPYNVPKSVTSRSDYPGDDVYNAMLYLLECMSNVSFHNDDDDQRYEQDILSQCQFAMIDLTHAAALHRSDLAMIEMAQILEEKHKDVGNGKLDKLETWEIQSRGILANSWSETHQTFLSQFVHVAANETTEVSIPIAGNFMILYGEILTDLQQIYSLTYQYLEPWGPFSFDCEDYPVLSTGDCLNNNATASAVTISPLFNRWIADGLTRNEAHFLGNYTANSTLNLVCGLDNVETSNVTKDCINPIFSSNFLPRDERGKDCCVPFGDNDTVGYTATAAVVHDLMVEMKTYTYENSPPFANWVVICLISIELVIAFSIGVSCIVLSINLMKRVKADDQGDTFLKSYKDVVVDLYGEREELLPDDAQSTSSDPGNLAFGESSLLEITEKPDGGLFRYLKMKGLKI